MYNVKKFLSLLLAFVLLFSLFACAKEKETPLPTEPILRQEIIDDVPIVEYESDYEPYTASLVDETSRVTSLDVKYTDLPYGAKLATFTGTQSTNANDIFAGYAYIYMPGTGIVARTSFGEHLADSLTEGTYRQTTSELVANEQAKGLKVLAACNGGFYKLFEEQMMYPGDRKGAPLDLVVKNQWICTSDDGYPAVGFYSDGSAIFGSAYMNAKVRFNDDETTHRIRNINKGQSTKDITLFTEDFSDTTSSVVDSCEVVCRVTGGILGFNKTLDAVVESVNLNTSNTKTQDGYVILSAPMGVSEAIEKLKVGDMVHIECTTKDKRWENVVHACGASHVILWEGKLKEASRQEYGPRTCIGAMEDGTVVVMVIDGRQKGYSVGVTIPGAAYVLKQLGCIYGVNLDGGGSTTLVVDQDDDSQVELINKPSDKGNQRKNAYGLVFYYKDK